MTVVFHRTRSANFRRVSGAHGLTVYRDPGGGHVTIIAITDEATRWAERAGITGTEFRTLTEARHALTAAIAVSGPPSTASVTLSRQPDGSYRTRDSAYVVTRRQAGGAESITRGSPSPWWRITHRRDGLVGTARTLPEARHLIAGRHLSER